MNKGIKKKRDLDDAEIMSGGPGIRSIKQHRRLDRAVLEGPDAPTWWKEIGRARHPRRLPAAPSIEQEEITTAMTAPIAETDATSPKDMGKIMKADDPEARRQVRIQSHHEPRAIPPERFAPDPTPRASVAPIDRLSRTSHTCTSRFLGVVREQALAYPSAPATRARRVRHRLSHSESSCATSSPRVPSPRRSCPTFTQPLSSARGQAAAWRLAANLVVNALAVVVKSVTHPSSASGARRVLVGVRGGLRRHSRQARADGALTRVMLPFLTLWRWRPSHGHAERAAHFFIPARRRPCSTWAPSRRARPEPRCRTRASRPSPGSPSERSWADSAQRLVQVPRWPAKASGPPRLDPRDAGLRRVLRLTGPHHRRRDAGQRVRQHRARVLPRGRGPFVARRRLPLHVSPDRPLRRSHRHRHAAGHVAAERARGPAGFRARSPTRSS